MNYRFNLEMECDVCGAHLMFQPLEIICEYIKHKNKVQEVHRYR